MKNSNNIRQGGIGFFSLLGLIFITLRLCKIITWSWWWVLSPLWGPVVLAFVVLCIMLICALIEDERDNRRWAKSVEQKYKKE